ncbi:MAG: hypothetical protein WC477_04365 [Patescibacteria group bacterium]
MTIINSNQSSVSSDSTSSDSNTPVVANTNEAATSDSIEATSSTNNVAPAAVEQTAKKYDGPLSLEQAREIVGSTIEKNRANDLGDESVPKAAKWAHYKILPRIADPNEQATFRRELRQLNPPPALDAQRVFELIQKRIGNSKDREEIVYAVKSVIGIIYHADGLNQTERQALITVARDFFPKITLDVARAEFENSNNVLETAFRGLECRDNWEPAEAASIEAFIEGAVQSHFTKTARSSIELKYAVAGAKQFLSEARDRIERFRNPQQQNRRPASSNNRRFDNSRPTVLIPSNREAKLKTSASAPSVLEQAASADQRKKSREERAKASTEASRRLTQDMQQSKSKKERHEDAPKQGSAGKNRKKNGKKQSVQATA